MGYHVIHRCLFSGLMKDFQVATWLKKRGHRVGSWQAFDILQFMVIIKHRNQLSQSQTNDEDWPFDQNSKLQRMWFSSWDLFQVSGTDTPFAKGVHKVRYCSLQALQSECNARSRNSNHGQLNDQISFLLVGWPSFQNLTSTDYKNLSILTSSGYISRLNWIHCKLTIIIVTIITTVIIMVVLWVKKRL